MQHRFDLYKVYGVNWGIEVDMLKWVFALCFVEEALIRSLGFCSTLLANE